MTGIKTLKVPAIDMLPKIYIIACTINSRTIIFKQAGYSLESVITKCYYDGNYMTLDNYLRHQTLTINEINTLFKNL